jgi:hypothetical protein
MQLVTPDSMSVPTLRRGYHKGGVQILVVHPGDPQLLPTTVKTCTHQRSARALVADLSKTDGHILLGKASLTHNA